MAMLRFVAQFSHLAKHRDAFSVRIQFDERAQRRFHRFGICVVTVINELNSADLSNLQSRFSQRRTGKTGRGFFERKTEHAAGGYSEHRVLHHVQTGHRQLGTATMSAF